MTYPRRRRLPVRLTVHPDARIDTRRWRKLRDRVVREEPGCWLRLPGCTGRSETADHIIPRVRRPDLTYVRGNCRGACHYCNRQRGDRPVRELPQLRAVMAARQRPAKALRFFG